MKIGMLADVYKTQVSGVTHSIALTKQWLEKSGHDVYVFTFGDEDIVDTEKNIIRTPGVPLVDTGIYLNIGYDKTARRMLYKMDIAHVHHPFISGSLAMRYCVPRNIPIIFTNHTRYDRYAHAYLPILPDEIGEAAVKAYLAPFFHACELVIVPTLSMVPVMTDVFGCKSPIEVIPNGVDLAPFRNMPQPIRRAEIGFTDRDVVAIYVGRLAPEKNLSLLVKAFYGVACTYQQARLLIAGDGPEKKELEAQVNHLGLGSKVHFTGMVDYRDVPQYLATADIFVTPSSSETFGLSTVEAMAAGLPVLGIDAPGTADLIEDGVTGLISPEDVVAFSVKFALLVSNVELRKRMGEQACLTSDKYDIKTTVDLLIQHYQHLVEKARQGNRTASPSTKLLRGKIR